MGNSNIQNNLVVQLDVEVKKSFNYKSLNLWKKVPLFLKKVLFFLLNRRCILWVSAVHLRVFSCYIHAFLWIIIILRVHCKMLLTWFLFHLSHAYPSESFNAKGQGTGMLFGQCRSIRTHVIELNSKNKTLFL